MTFTIADLISAFCLGYIFFAFVGWIFQTRREQLIRKQREQWAKEDDEVDK